MQTFILFSLFILLKLNLASEEYVPKITENARKLSDDNLRYYVNTAQNLWIAKPSKFTSEEKKARALSLKFLKPHDDVDKEYEPTEEFLADIPDVFDSRDNWPKCSYLRQIRDQSDCGSAAHMVAAGIASDRTCIFSNGTFDLPLSAEDPLSCCVGILSECGDGYGCDGSWPQDILKYWQVHGLCTGGIYGSHVGCKPYPIYPCDKKYKNGTTSPPCPGYHTPICVKECTNDIPWPIDYLKDKHFGKKHYKVGKKMTQIQTEIMTNGPVIASFQLYEDFWDYKTGIYVHLAGDLIGGMVTKMIGWGVENGTPYWLCAHQWGDDFGENGYFKILRGVNECGIEHQIIAALPDLTKSN